MVAAMIQGPFWAYEADASGLRGVERVVAALNNSSTGPAFQQLVAVNGAMYYAEQVMQFKAIESYQSLTYSVIDTVRRLAIVVVTGYFLRGDKFNLTKSAGVVIVCAGAIYYNVSKEQSSSAEPAKAKGKNKGKKAKAS